MIFLMPIYVLIAAVVIYRLVKKYKGRHKWAYFFALTLLFVLPVSWDVILGRAYFNYLCEKDGGIHIFQTVELGPEYWKQDGSPKFYTERGDFDKDYFDGRYEINVDIDKKFKATLPVLRSFIQVVDTKTDNVLGEVVSYLYTHGWVMHTWQPFHVGSDECPRLSDYPTPSNIKDNPLVEGKGPRWYRKFESYIFLKSDNKEVE